jgi:hypothetical protein
LIDNSASRDYDIHDRFGDNLAKSKRLPALRGKNEKISSRSTAEAVCHINTPGIVGLDFVYSPLAYQIPVWLEAFSKANKRTGEPTPDTPDQCSPSSGRWSPIQRDTFSRREHSQHRFRQNGCFSSTA